jgi:hypothetical protein
MKARASTDRARPQASPPASVFVEPHRFQDPQSTQRFQRGKAMVLLPEQASASARPKTESDSYRRRLITKVTVDDAQPAMYSHSLDQIAARDPFDKPEHLATHIDG